ncbi:MAG: preprotein translocase subunit SecY [Clostridia bacterium]|nr:preprotein translocase subunit SecY [Clostridia bacterium]MBQ2237713.1 preprotein translocase subunit SecY [Clostridia bacterium]
MLETLRNAWRIKELRNKILFTLFIILVFRVGSVIPVPYIDVAALKSAADSGATNEFFSYLSILTGGGLEYGAIFAMSVTPYINSSIIIQLLCVAIPALERLQKEGEEGQKKLAQITRYTTVGLGLLQGTAYFIYLNNSGYLSVDGGAVVFAAFVIVLAFTAGSALVMWLGEQIDVKGIGNGISMLLFAGIISRGPQAFNALVAYWKLEKQFEVIAIVILFLLVIGFIVWMTNAERRIPIQYAKRVVGNKMYGGQNTHIPIKVNMAGVMPIIFSSSILMLPTMILSFMKDTTSTWYKVLSLFSVQGVFYAVVYFVLIIGFAYFYATIQFNPVEMANNLRKNGGAVPGIRPGKPTSDFISKILSRITLLGALFLSVIAILPIILGSVGGINISLGGTSVLILVGVALDTVRNLESQMMMRHYKGFLD